MKSTASFEAPIKMTGRAQRDTTLASTKGVFSFEESDGYMEFSQIPAESKIVYKPDKHQDASNYNYIEPAIYSSIDECKKPSCSYSVVLNYQDDKTVDFGAREVNAVKLKLCGQKDFIEVDLTEVGSTLIDLQTLICKEFDITVEDIVCIRKLPDVTIRSDKDIVRIRAGRKLEVKY